MTVTQQIWDGDDCPRVLCDGTLQQDEAAVECSECGETWTHHTDESEHLLISRAGKIVKRKQRVLPDGGEIDAESDRVDPERLPDTYTPAYVDVRGQGPVYVANYETLSSGWVSFTEWRGREGKLPPHRIGGIREVRTEHYDQSDEERVYVKGKRVADADDLDRAQPDDGAGKAVVADD
ncbi:MULTISPECIES: hypothetical protein [Halomicrobium]|uniref:C2H2-type domain-containing protein n=2 Tax=Halomicrobium mukohataei TaxID=57705 RepID=C7P3Z2_HALMD|nr:MULTISPECIES: hypothetical protein [Halomicrobium]ACV47814.1 hypothetical protein Hmuk_1700 [Halomicrobium mukohataei DSM 12286]QCD66262.1 hypothetical protein E5139_11635 [Halomicrobium mukohataei]QFR21068.1 hypothetical protein GBQ70_11630 [Halomicrobium sp. ZPS1]